MSDGVDYDYKKNRNESVAYLMVHKILTSTGKPSIFEELNWEYLTILMQLLHMKYIPRIRNMIRIDHCFDTLCTDRWL